MTYTDVSEYDEKRLHARDFDLLMGIARLLAAKSELEESDIDFLDSWLSENPRAMTQPVFKPILEFMEESGWAQLTSPLGLSALHVMLRKLSGDSNNDGKPDGPTAIAYTSPPPTITFSKKRFCFTGTFCYGGRKKCEEAVVARGASVGNIAQSTHYLVVGSRVTDSWKHSTFGMKISQAVAWGVNIVREEDWRAALEGNTGAEGPNPTGGASPPGSNGGDTGSGKPFGTSKETPPFGDGPPSGEPSPWNWCVAHWKALGIVIAISSIVGWSLA